MPILYEPLYRTVPVNEWELGLLSLPCLERLRYTKQMGLVHLIFLGAMHTRLEHSIGAMHLAGKIAASIDSNSAMPISTNNSVSIARIAALFHDVGHIPFSHATEQLLMRLQGITHERLSVKIVEENRDRITRYCRGIIDEEGVERIKAIILHNSTAETKYLEEVISGTIDADRLDYLRRDAYYTGLAVGLMNVELLILYLCKVHFGSQTRLAVRSEGLSDVASLLIARDLNYAGIVFRSDVRGVNASLLRAMEILVGDNVEELERIAKLTDDDVLRRMRAKSKTDNVLAFLLRTFNERQLLQHIPSQEPISWEKLARLNAELYSVLAKKKEAVDSAKDEAERSKQFKDLYSFLFQVRHRIEEAILAKVGCRHVLTDIPPPPKIQELDSLVVVKGRPKLLRSQYSALAGIEESTKKRWTLLAFTEPAKAKVENCRVFEKCVEDCSLKGLR